MNKEFDDLIELGGEDDFWDEIVVENLESLSSANHFEALSCETRIEEENGQWVVYLKTTFPDRTVDHRIEVYSSRRKAELAANWIYRAANRDLKGRNRNS